MKSNHISSWLGLLLLVMICFTASGCRTLYTATIGGGNSKNITVRTNPPGADVYYGEKYIGKTPCDFFFDLKGINGLTFLRIEKDGKHYGYLQMVDFVYDEDLMDMFTLIDIATFWFLVADVVVGIPLFVLRSVVYDNLDLDIVYNGRTINLASIKTAPPPEGYWRVISPYQDLYGEVDKTDVFIGFRRNGTYRYQTQEQLEHQRRAREAAMQAAVSSMVTNIQQINPPPSKNLPTKPMIRPTPATTSPSSVIKKPNTTRFCNKVNSKGVVHGEWDQRFSPGCPACRGGFDAW